MDLSQFPLPDDSLIDADPPTFKQQFQAFIDALTAHQSDAGSAELRALLEESERARQEAEQQARAHAEAAEASRVRHQVAVAAYRQVLLTAEPSVPPELVQGETVEDVDASLAKAHGVVEYIREKLEAAGGAGAPGQMVSIPPRVPAGAPGRTPPDLSNMSAREKLVFGARLAAG